MLINMYSFYYFTVGILIIQYLHLYVHIYKFSDLCFTKKSKCIVL